MTVTSAWVGAVTDSAAQVVAVVSAVSNTFLHVDTDPTLATPVVFGPVTPNAQGVAVLVATGLDPSTRYYWQVEHGGSLDGNESQFLTHPPAGQPASFTFGAASCAGLIPSTPGVGSVLAADRLSNHTIFDVIRERAVDEDWLFFAHLGDLHYYDLGSGLHGIAGGASLANYRTSYDDVLAQPRQQAMYRNLPTDYVWDDHDYGPNNSDGTHSGKANAQQAYRERVPHYPLSGSPSTAGLTLTGAAADGASTPDDAVLDITGDIDIRFDGAIEWFLGSGFQYLTTKYNTTGNQRSYALRLNSTTFELQLVWSPDGTTVESATATDTLTPDADNRLAVRATLDVDNDASGHTVTFYTAPTIAGPWTQLGDPVIAAGTTSIFAGTADLWINSINGGTSSPVDNPGTVFAAEVRDGINGTMVANPDFTAQPPSTTSFDDDAGRTWTVQGNSEIVAESGDGPIYHSFQVGRILFIVSDTRSDRSPNADPDTGAKTMLGSAQKEWIASTLAGTSAQLLVWLLPSQWMGTSNDSYAVFQVERSEMIDIFAAGDWLERMCIVSGDVHALAIDTGGNSPGGIPVFQFASLDSDPVATQNHYDTGITQPGRNQYGTMEIVDTGDQITVTGIGWIVASEWRSHSFTATIEPFTPPSPPDPQPPPTQEAVAVIRQRVTWLGCRLVDGRIVAELPDITGQVSRVLGDVTTSGLTLPIPLSGPAALPIGLVEQATEPGRSMIVAVINDIPTWAGVVGASEGGTESTMSLPVASLEAYLTRRIVRDHHFDQVDEATIAATLVGDAGDIPGVGFGIGLVIDAPPTGTLRDRTYVLTDRKTVLEALQELMGVINGPEWTIDLDWTDSTKTAISKIFRVRKRIGVAASTPQSVFVTTAHSVFNSRNGSEARYLFKIDYTEGHGANYVVAYSSGEGEDQPESVPAVDLELLATGFPIYEQHFEPSSNIISQSVLDSHAIAELGRRSRGTRTFSIEARWDAYPRYGVDWQLGDDIAWKLVGHRHPQGIQGVSRVIGFELDMQSQVIIPILLREDL